VVVIRSQLLLLLFILSLRRLLLLRCFALCFLAVPLSSPTHTPFTLSSPFLHPLHSPSSMPMSFLLQQQQQQQQQKGYAAVEKDFVRCLLEAVPPDKTSHPMMIHAFKGECSNNNNIIIIIQFMSRSVCFVQSVFSVFLQLGSFWSFVVSQWCDTAFILPIHICIFLNHYYIDCVFFFSLFFIAHQ
jgi:hypothetical protein